MKWHSRCIGSFAHSLFHLNESEIHRLLQLQRHHCLGTRWAFSQWIVYAVPKAVHLTIPLLSINVFYTPEAETYFLIIASRIFPKCSGVSLQFNLKINWEIVILNHSLVKVWFWKLTMRVPRARQEYDISRILSLLEGFLLRNTIRIL